jgi:hypothetical protein
VSRLSRNCHQRARARLAWPSANDGSDRHEASRFSIGDFVEIRDVIATQHAGEAGQIVDIEPSRYSFTLDKYVVRLTSGEEKEFWDIQLREIPAAKKKSASS